MNIKLFNLPTFEEWEANKYETRKTLGAYRCDIRAFSRSINSIDYMFAVSLSNLNPLNIYSEKLFFKRFEYVGDAKKLEAWYDDCILEFNAFWENHIKSTYLKIDENE